MSINNTSRKTAVMIGNGTSVKFPFVFRINDEEDLKVYVKIGENGQYELKTLNTDYKLSDLVYDTNNNIISGNIEYPIIIEGEPDQPSPLTSNDSIYGLRETPKTQEESSAQVSFKSKDMERALDKATMQIQELQEEVDRSYKAPSYQSAIDEADFYTVAENIDKVNTVAANIPAIETSNDNAAAISTVANNISDVNAVGQNISNVNDVADDLTNIDTVKNNLTDIVTVSTNISDVNTVGQNITDVETVADNLTDISTVADNATDVTTVASISTAVSKVADNESNVNMVSDNMANVNTIASNMNSVLTVSGDISNVNTVAGNTTNINTVAGISSNVTTVAGIASDVTDVKNNATNITTVATNISNVNTTATNISNINTAASNIAAIIAAPTAAQNAATSATNAQKWAEGADADVTPLGGTHSSKGWANRAQEIVESLGAIYKPAGSIVFASLPALSADVLGNVYNITDSFTTTADFVEGAGDSYPAGTNVAIVDVGTGGSHSYKYDVLSGVVDLSAYRTSAAQDLIDAGKADNTNKVNGIPLSTANAYYYAESTSAADAVQKEVSIPAITALNAGQVIIVKPTVTSTVANSTLKLNGFNAYPMLYGGSNITTSTDSKVWSAYIPSIFVFDGSYWRFAGHGADDNTTYTLNYVVYAGTANAGVGSNAVKRYSLLMQKLDGTWETLVDTTAAYSTGTTKTVNTNGFIPGKITYYNTTTVKKNGEAIGVSSLYLKSASVDARYSFNCGATPGWSAGDSIYVVGTIGTDGLFYLDSTTWWTNALPTTQDGKVYMYIGTYLSDAYKITLDLDHPMFYYDGTSVKPYVVAGNKQDKLVSGTNIKTVNNTSLLGSGDVTISATAAWGSITGTLSDQTDLQNQLNSKAPAILLSYFPSDHKVNNISFLRGDTFSWQSGSTYIAVYDHLTDDLITTLYDQDDYTVVGSPTISSGVVSDFSSSNYVTYPSFTDDGEDVKMTIGFMLPSGYTDYAKPLTSFGNSGSNCSMFVVQAYKGGVEFRIKSGLSLSVQYSLQEETLYIAELKRKKGVYTLKLYNPLAGVLGTATLTDATLIANGDTSVIKYGHDGKVFGSEFPGSIYMAYTTVGYPTPSTKTIAGTTITYYLADDGHEIVLADQESNVIDIYNKTGTAWFFIVDSTNTKFKLPRKNDHHGALIERSQAGTEHKLIYEDGWCIQGGYVKASANQTTISLQKEMNGTSYSILLTPSVTDRSNTSRLATVKAVTSTSFDVVGLYQGGLGSDYSTYWQVSGYMVDTPENSLKSSSKYLYFYVGTFTNTALQETAGLNAELFNDKADKDLSNVSNTSGLRRLIEVYKGNDGSWYKVFAEYDTSGNFVGNWCEQGGYYSTGIAQGQGTATITLLKPLQLNNGVYDLHVDKITSSTANTYGHSADIVSETQFTINNNGGLASTYIWRASGYIYYS